MAGCDNSDELTASAAGHQRSADEQMSQSARTRSQLFDTTQFQTTCIGC
jgi:hypothetical protein